MANRGIQQQVRSAEVILGEVKEDYVALLQRADDISFNPPATIEWE